MDIDEGIKLLNTVLYFKYENAFLRVYNDPGKLLASADGDVSQHLERIRRCIWEVHGHIPAGCCPDEGSLRLHVMKLDAVLEYWQEGFRQEMLKVNFNGRGWDVEPQQNRHYRGWQGGKEGCRG